MLWIILAFVIAVIASVVGLAFDSHSYASDTMAGTFFWCTFIPALAVAIWLNFHFADEYRLEVETYSNIQNIGDSNGVKGSFALFGGSIDNQPVYMYYLRDGKGRFTLHHVDANRAYVTYTNETPKIVYHSTKSRNNWMSVDWENSVDDYEFRVPEGSVKQNFNLDAQ